MKCPVCGLDHTWSGEETIANDAVDLAEVGEPPDPYVGPTGLRSSHDPSELAGLLVGRLPSEAKEFSWRQGRSWILGRGGVGHDQMRRLCRLAISRPMGRVR
jgi:hypothetical protein